MSETIQKPGLTTREAAMRLGVCYATMKRYITQKRIPVIRVSSRKFYIRPVDCDKFLERQTQPARGF